MPGIYRETPRVRAVHAFLAELGLPEGDVKSFEAFVDSERTGNRLTITYNLIRDDPFGDPYGDAANG